MEEKNSLNSEEQVAPDASEVYKNTKPVDKYGFFGGAQYTAPTEPLSKLTLDSIRSRELKWIEMIENWDRYMSKNFHKVKERCRKGIPDSLRSKAWQLLSGSYIHLSSRPRKFQCYLKGDANSLCVLEIRKDVNRQFPHHELFTEERGQGQEDLFNLLKAYSIHKPEVGYCQAQAPIAALLLTIMPLEQAFWCFTVTCDSYLPGYYDMGLEAVQVDSLVLMGLMKKCNSAAYRHLKKLKIDPLLWMVDWFMCIYARTLPWPTLLRVWDMFFCEGVKILFLVALAIVKIVLGTKEKIANSGGFYETLNLLKKVPQNLLTEDVFIPLMLKISVTSGDMEKEQKRQLRKWKGERKTKIPTENSKSIWKNKFFKMMPFNVEEKGDYVVRMAIEEPNDITDEELQKQLDRLQEPSYDGQLVNAHNNSFHIPVKRFSIKKLLSPPPRHPTQPPLFPPLHQQDAATDTTIDSLISLVKNKKDKNNDKEKEEKNDEDDHNALTESDIKESFTNKVHKDSLKTDEPTIEKNTLTFNNEIPYVNVCGHDNRILSGESTPKFLTRAIENDDDTKKNENNPFNSETNLLGDMKDVDETMDMKKIKEEIEQLKIDDKGYSCNTIDNHEDDGKVAFEGSFGEQANFWVGKYLIKNETSDIHDEEEEEKLDLSDEDETLGTIKRGCEAEEGLEECGHNINHDKTKSHIEKRIIYCAGDDVMLAGKDETNVVGDKGDNNLYEDHINEENIVCNEDCFTQDGLVTKSVLNDVEGENHYGNEKYNETFDEDRHNFDNSLDASVFTVVPNTSVLVPPEAENFNNNHDLVGGFNDYDLLTSEYKDNEEKNAEKYGADGGNESDDNNGMGRRDNENDGGGDNDNFGGKHGDAGSDVENEEFLQNGDDDDDECLMSDKKCDADEHDEDDYGKNELNDKDEDNDNHNNNNDDEEDKYNNNNDDEKDRYNNDNDDDDRYNNGDDDDDRYNNDNDDDRYNNAEDQKKGFDDDDRS